MAKKTKSLTVVDTRGGSLSYNRLDFQVSQVFLFAIELYDTQDYLMILDHYDDISVFEDQAPYNIASHYQVKTKDDSISLSFALSEGWIEKLYSHMEN